MKINCPLCQGTGYVNISTIVAYVMIISNTICLFLLINLLLFK